MLRTANCCSDPLLLLTVKSFPLFPWISKELDEMLGGGAVELASEKLKVSKNYANECPGHEYKTTKVRDDEDTRQEQTHPFHFSC